MAGKRCTSSRSPSAWSAPARPRPPGDNHLMNAVNIAEHIASLGLQAREASARMAAAPAAQKAEALRGLGTLLRTSGEALQAANAKDIERATAAGLAAPMVDRLKL